MRKRWNSGSYLFTRSSGQWRSHSVLSFLWVWNNRHDQRLLSKYLTSWLFQIEKKISALVGNIGPAPTIWRCAWVWFKNNWMLWLVVLGCFILLSWPIRKLDQWTRTRPRRLQLWPSWLTRPSSGLAVHRNQNGTLRVKRLSNYKIRSQDGQF